MTLKPAASLPAFLLRQHFTQFQSSHFDPDRSIGTPRYASSGTPAWPFRNRVAADIPQSILPA
jgi:hypothetical protein